MQVPALWVQLEVNLARSPVLANVPLALFWNLFRVRVKKLPVSVKVPPDVLVRVGAMSIIEPVCAGRLLDAVPVTLKAEPELKLVPIV